MKINNENFTGWTQASDLALFAYRMCPKTNLKHRAFKSVYGEKLKIMNILSILDKRNVNYLAEIQIQAAINLREKVETIVDENIYQRP